MYRLASLLLLVQQQFQDRTDVVWLLLWQMSSQPCVLHCMHAYFIKHTVQLMVLLLPVVFADVAWCHAVVMRPPQSI